MAPAKTKRLLGSRVKGALGRGHGPHEEVPSAMGVSQWDPPPGHDRKVHQAALTIARHIRRAANGLASGPSSPMTPQLIHSVPQGRSALRALALTSFAACAGDTADETDIAKLIQTGEYAEATLIAEHRLRSVPKGTTKERSLVLDYVEALSFTDGKKAQNSFLDFAATNPDLVTPRHFSLVAAALRTNERYFEAVDVAYAGMTRWPDDPTLESIHSRCFDDAIRSVPLKQLHCTY